MTDTLRREAPDASRRKALKTGAVTAAWLSGAAALPTIAKETDMDIARYEPTPAHPGIPLISYAVSHGGLVYLAGVTANPAQLGDVKDQTRQVLARIDSLLATAGTSKSKLLSATVWLTDMSLFAAHNDAWNEWVDPKNTPVRACLHSAQLWRPGMLVEIMVTAAK